ncbi:YybH family protein [Dyadobacter bucti]|uniref:YybH family protein n=1 Tax=Dyadobacter bucti TaxID=2572203 RepID=UPI00140B782D|nr:SgcJ/EcaC family oxidoreductase [Dyadobacter bucti]
MEKDKPAIEKLLNDYAKALIDGDAATLASLYCNDGEFMPDGFATIRGAQQIHSGAQRFFQTQSLKAEFLLKNLAVERDFAFAESIATVTTENNQGQSIAVKTRDFFVVRREAEDWKILRYIFNKI